jgi:hypothetical protein
MHGSRIRRDNNSSSSDRACNNANFKLALSLISMAPTPPTAREGGPACREPRHATPWHNKFPGSRACRMRPASSAAAWARARGPAASFVRAIIDDDSLLPAHCAVGPSPESRPNHARKWTTGRPWSSGIRHARFGSALLGCLPTVTLRSLVHCIGCHRNPGPTVLLLLSRSCRW